MTRKDFIVVAEGLIAMIQAGHIKKKFIDEALTEMGHKLLETNPAFSYQTFNDYVKARV